jgi:hypothetical protein
MKLFILKYVIIFKELSYHMKLFQGTILRYETIHLKIVFVIILKNAEIYF